MAPHRLRKEAFDTISPGFVGLTLEEAAKQVGCTPGSLRVRFSSGGYDVSIRKGVITEFNLPYTREEVATTNPTFSPTSTQENVKKRNQSQQPYKEPTRIVLADSEFEEVQFGFRERSKKHRSYRHFV